MTTTANDLNVIRKVPMLEPLPPGGYLDLTDAAKYLGVARSTMQRWLEEGRVEALRDEPHSGRAGWRWLIPTSDLKRVKRQMGKG